MDFFNLYNHDLSKCELKWLSVCCCRGAYAPCLVMVTISCACGETHFEVWFWSFKFCNLVSYWQLAFLVLFHLDSWMIVLYWDWLWLLWNHCCETMYNMLVSFENSLGFKCYSRDDDFFVYEVFILNTRLYKAWSSLYYHSILLLYWGLELF